MQSRANSFKREFNNYIPPPVKGHCYTANTHQIKHMSIKILIYDDNDALRTSMEALIADDEEMELAALMPNAETVETDIAEINPDVVLMDIDIPGTNGCGSSKAYK